MLCVSYLQFSQGGSLWEGLALYVINVIETGMVTYGILLVLLRKVSFVFPLMLLFPLDHKWGVQGGQRLPTWLHSFIIIHRMTCTAETDSNMRSRLNAHTTHLHRPALTPNSTQRQQP